ncbi:hypothetical protein [Paraburkholderia elongata]|uniref:hypothetical protein n=1 Tax=Paraburkholderia elongata TaxID=2675747 RepID=UPI001F18C477|nr:hypothetical protein [Paraburkholderia elongata]
MKQANIANGPQQVNNGSALPYSLLSKRVTAQWRGVMADFLRPSPQLNAEMPDTAVIRVDQLHALAGLLSLGEVAEQFSDLSTVAQVSIFWSVRGRARRHTRSIDANGDCA